MGRGHLSSTRTSSIVAESGNGRRSAHASDTQEPSSIPTSNVSLAVRLVLLAEEENRSAGSTEAIRCELGERGGPDVWDSTRARPRSDALARFYQTPARIEARCSSATVEGDRLIRGPHPSGTCWRARIPHRKARPGVRHLQNLVSARPWPSAASPRASSALRMQRRRTKPLRGGPTARSPLGIESPDPMPREPPGGVLGVTERSARGCGDGAMLSTRVAIQGVPTPPVQGGRSRTRV
jgi:hypothetical protein